MLGCWSSLRREISLMAVLGTPSSSDSSLIFFMATIAPVLLFLAEHEKSLNWKRWFSNPTFEDSSICALSNLLNLEEVLQLMSCPTGGHFALI